MANVGLVLSGGIAKGAYQIGVLKAISEFFSSDDIKTISAASIGTLNAYAFATDKLECLEEMWKNINITGMNDFINRILRRAYIFNAIDNFVDEKDKLNRCVYTTCFNISKLKVNYVNLNTLGFDERVQYLKASTTLPVFSKAMRIGEDNYFDGAMIDNIPIIPLLKHDLDFIIVVYFDNYNYSFENQELNDKVIKINFMDNGIVKDAISMDEATINYMIEKGYEKSRNVFETILQNGIDDIEYIYEKINFFNSLHINKKTRLTADVLVDNMNKIAKKVIKEST